MDIQFAVFVMATVLSIGGVGFGLLAHGINSHAPGSHPTAKTVLLSAMGSAVVALAFAVAAVLT